MRRAQPIEVSSIKAAIAGLKRRRRFIRYGETRALARELRGVLAQIEASVAEPVLGLELVSAFMDTDDPVNDCCDDSGGYVGDVYRDEALALYIHFASRCHDKEWLESHFSGVLRRGCEDLRCYYINKAAEILDQQALRRLVESRWAEFESEQAAAAQELLQRGPDRLGLSSYSRPLSEIASLAKQLRDPQLLEESFRARNSELADYQMLEMAQLHLDMGEAEACLEWLNRASPIHPYHAHSFSNLSLAAHRALGNADESQQLAWQIFRSQRSLKALRALLGVLGEDQRESVINNEAKLIAADPKVDYEGMVFLAQLGLLQECEDYLLQRRADLDGDRYYYLVDAAKALSAGPHPLGASLCYRACIDSILARAQSRYYGYALEYMHYLELLEGRVSDWRQVPTHAEYLSELRRLHARKYAFWDRV